MAYQSIDSSPQSTMAHKPADSLPSWPLTPPDPPPPTSSAMSDVSSVVTAIHVMATERAALAHLERLYQTDAQAQQGLARAVDLIARSVQDAGKLVVCGVGKSGKIGRKIEATMNSMGIYSAFLHPTEALHGDLGLVRPVSSHLHLCTCIYIGICICPGQCVDYSPRANRIGKSLKLTGIYFRMTRFYSSHFPVVRLNFCHCCRIFPPQFLSSL